MFKTALSSRSYITFFIIAQMIVVPTTQCNWKDAIKNPWFHIGGALAITYIGWHDFSRYAMAANGWTRIPKQLRENNQNDINTMHKDITAWDVPMYPNDEIISREKETKMSEWPNKLTLPEHLETIFTKSSQGRKIPGNYKAYVIYQQITPRGPQPFFPI